LLAHALKLDVSSHPSSSRSFHPVLVVSLAVAGGGIVIIHQGAGRQGGLSLPGPGPVLVKQLKAGSAMQNGLCCSPR
jgi:hypothetical protein